MEGTFAFCFSSINLYNRSRVFACSCSCLRVSCYDIKSIDHTSSVLPLLFLTAYCAFIYCMLCLACVNSVVMARRLSASALTFLFAELIGNQATVNDSKCLLCLVPPPLTRLWPLIVYTLACFDPNPAGFFPRYKSFQYITLPSFFPIHPLTNLDSSSC